LTVKPAIGFENLKEGFLCAGAHALGSRTRSQLCIQTEIRPIIRLRMLGRMGYRLRRCERFGRALTEDVHLQFRVRTKPRHLVVREPVLRSTRVQGLREHNRDSLFYDFGSGLGTVPTGTLATMSPCHSGMQSKGESNECCP